MTEPTVSVAIANYNGARYLEDAVACVLRQDLRDVEVIVVDDASTDDSVARARAMAREDRRIRVEAMPWNRGPGAARNRALELARGRWLAILDGDDLMHPQRLGRLTRTAEAAGADIIADDLLVFRQDQPGFAQRFLRGRRSEAPSWLAAEDFLRETCMFGRGANLGYLKPIVRLSAWRQAGVRYDETLPIGEDHDLLLRLLASGLRCRIEPWMGYFYRKHASSTSHRMAGDALARMIEADSRFRAWTPRRDDQLTRALDERLESIRTARRFTCAVEALKARRPLEALRQLAADPRAAWLLHMPLGAALARLGRRVVPPRAAPARPPGRPLVVVSRQRLTGRTNGSSNYLLDVAQAAREAGFDLRLVQPSPAVLGRWPAMRLRPEMKLFSDIAMRGVFRMGDWVLARDPAVYAAALRWAGARTLRRLRLPSDWIGSKPAPYAVAAAWTAEDQLFVARQARGAEVIIADYAWQTEAFAYALTPRARTAVVMHDLFHSRAALFREMGQADSVAAPSREEESSLLRRADAVVAIQQAEADTVRQMAPEAEVILLPMTAEARATPQPGSDHGILFVGSNAAPNVLGMEWFCAKVWPILRAARPQAELSVAGNVSRNLPPPPQGVRYLGVVDDLAPLYDAAGVVISPLTTGSGLKIKLVEALAQGKACVATTVTLQGVEQELGEAVARADAPEAFAAAVADLLASETARIALGRRALEAVADHFSPARARAGFRDWLLRRPRLRGVDGPRLRLVASRG